MSLPAFFSHEILEELFRLPIYWQAHCAGRQCPNWATSFLSGFDWTSARLEALLASVLQPDVDPEPLVMNVTPSNADWSEENDDVTPRDMEVDMDSAEDPVDAALERDLQSSEIALHPLHLRCLQLLIRSLRCLQLLIRSLRCLQLMIRSLRCLQVPIRRLKPLLVPV